MKAVAESTYAHSRRVGLSHSAKGYIIWMLRRAQRCKVVGRIHLQLRHASAMQLMLTQSWQSLL